LIDQISDSIRYPDDLCHGAQSCDRAELFADSSQPTDDPSNFGIIAICILIDEMIEVGMKLVDFGWRVHRGAPLRGLDFA
jgi:hypothetical protein